MNLSTLNWPAVIVATLSAFVLGALWYSPVLFGKAWMRANNISPDGPKTGMARILILALVWTFVMAVNLAMFLNDKQTNVSWGATAGLLAGFGWVAMAIFIIGLFERRSLAYMLINAGYMIAALTMMGAILGGWR
jgi:hypothetical protein